jgi:hypothetical protein
MPEPIPTISLWLCGLVGIAMTLLMGPLKKKTQGTIEESLFQVINATQNSHMDLSSVILDKNVI